MDTKLLIDKCHSILDDMKGKDIVLLDLDKKTIIADYFIIVTANNDRHASAMLNTLIDETKKIKRKAINRDGVGSSGWLVVDFGDVMVHIFLEHIRRLYDLESLWTIEYNKITEQDEQID